MAEAQAFVGRDARADLVLTHPTVSRWHALLLEREDGWHVIDRDSANGTYVNGKRVAGSAPLRPGDRVRFGSDERVFHLSWESRLRKRAPRWLPRWWDGMLNRLDARAGALVRIGGGHTTRTDRVVLGHVIRAGITSELLSTEDLAELTGIAGKLIRDVRVQGLIAIDKFNDRIRARGSPSDVVLYLHDDGFVYTDTRTLAALRDGALDRTALARLFDRVLADAANRVLATDQHRIVALPDLTPLTDAVGAALPVTGRFKRLGYAAGFLMTVLLPHRAAQYVIAGGVPVGAALAVASTLTATPLLPLVVVNGVVVLTGVIALSAGQRAIRATDGRRGLPRGPRAPTAGPAADPREAFDIPGWEELAPKVRAGFADAYQILVDRGYAEQLIRAQENRPTLRLLSMRQFKQASHAAGIRGLFTAPSGFASYIKHGITLRAAEFRPGFAHFPAARERRLLVGAGVLLHEWEHTVGGSLGSQQGERNAYRVEHHMSRAQRARWSLQRAATPGERARLQRIADAWDQINAEWEP
ncbi:MAG: FHA domain-containing protein, partial [Pseudonocardia sp.]